MGSFDSRPFGEDAHHSSKVDRTGNGGGLSLLGCSPLGRSAASLSWVSPVFKDWLCPKGAAL